MSRYVLIKTEIERGNYECTLAPLDNEFNVDMKKIVMVDTQYNCLKWVDENFATVYFFEEILRVARIANENDVAVSYENAISVNLEN